MSNITISQFIKSTIDSFCGYNPYLKQDIQALVCDVLEVDRTYLYFNLNKLLNRENLADLKSKVVRLQNDEPLAYILGYKHFWNQKIFVTIDTLIPRADTEILVEAVLNEIENKNDDLNILDLGTGTGAIALALAGELSNAKIIAVDFPDKALEVAKKNAVENNIKNVRFIQSDWYKKLEDLKFDVIVSNPPYIDESDNDIDFNVKIYEPASALFAKENGLEDIEKIISQSSNYLNKNGRVYIEHGHTQAQAVSDICAKYDFFKIKTVKDLNGKDRCTKAFFVSKEI